MAIHSHYRHIHTFILVSLFLIDRSFVDFLLLFIYLFFGQLINKIATSESKYENYKTKYVLYFLLHNVTVIKYCYTNKWGIFFFMQNSCLRSGSVRSYSAHIISSTWQHNRTDNITILFYFINIVSDKPASSKFDIVKQQQQSFNFVLQYK